MAGGYGDPVTRLDYQVSKAEERLRREQETALGSVLNLLSTISNKMDTTVSTISNKMDTTDSNIKDLRNEMESLSKAASNEMDSNIKDLRNEMESHSKAVSNEMESLSKGVSTLSTQLTMNSTIQFAILLVVATQVPFLQELTSVFLKFLK
jgi:gas vesicle protein